MSSLDVTVNGAPSYAVNVELTCQSLAIAASAPPELRCARPGPNGS